MDTVDSASTNPGAPFILIVDDEPEIRKLAGAMLARHGFNVIIADSGEQAAKIFKKDPASIDLLLTDVVAPGMSGPMLADQLVELKPSLRVLFMSGYDKTQVVQKYVVQRGYALLTKPFSMEQLEKKVREALSRSIATS